MVLSHKTYKDRTQLICDIKKEVLRDFKESDYTNSDKFNVSLHRVVDGFVSFISIADLEIYLNWFNVNDIKTLDSGMLPDRLEDRKKYDRCLLYCLIEQDLYNDEELNKLQ